jgi:hypothetical protein
MNRGPPAPAATGRIAGDTTAGIIYRYRYVFLRAQSAHSLRRLTTFAALAGLVAAPCPGTAQVQDPRLAGLRDVSTARISAYAAPESELAALALGRLEATVDAFVAAWRSVNGR